MRRALAVVLVVLFVSPGAVASLDRVPAAVFADRLTVAERLAVQGQAMPSPSMMRAVRDALGLPVRVMFPEGDEVVVRLDDFLAGLSGRHASHFDLAARHISAMHRALDQARAAAPPDRAQVRASLMRAYVGVSANAGWLERTRRAIISALKRFLERIFSYAGFGSIVAWVVVGTLLVSGVWALSRAFVPARRVRLRNADRPEEVDWRRLSVEALARGDAPEAVRAHYRLLLHALAREGILRESPSLTAGECRRSVGVERPSLVPAVSRATGVFERVAYGEQELRPGDIEAMQNAEAEVSSR